MGGLCVWAPIELNAEPSIIIIIIHIYTHNTIHQHYTFDLSLRMCQKIGKLHLVRHLTPWRRRCFFFLPQIHCYSIWYFAFCSVFDQQTHQPWSESSRLKKHTHTYESIEGKNTPSNKIIFFFCFFFFIIDDTAHK